MSATMTERQRLIGAAVERACGELPEGWQIDIEVERGAGTVCLIGSYSTVCIDSDEPFHEQINAAVQMAIDAAKEAP